MLVDLGEEPKHKNGPFTVAADLYSEQANHYVKHWEGGVYDNYDEAFDRWDRWTPRNLKKIMEERRKLGDYSHHELEIGIYSKYDTDLAFMNTTLDEGHEKS